MMKKLTLILFAIAGTVLLHSQKATDQASIQLEIPTGTEVFHIHNIYGPVEVTGTNSNVITINYKRTLKASTNSRLERDKKAIVLDTTFLDGNLIAFINAPDRKLKINEDGYAYYQGSWHNEDWTKKDILVSNTDYYFEIQVSVPSNMRVHASTHEEPITVKGMRSTLRVGNHHDDVKVMDQVGDVNAKTHHGSVEVRYTENPTGECSYKTHHGDLNVVYTGSLSADVALSSYHGEFYTDYDYSLQPIQVSQKRASKAKYVVKSKGTTVRFGSGGELQQFKTHHGDIYLKNQSK